MIMKGFKLQFYILLFLLIKSTFSLQSNFTAYFTGEQEAPPVNTNARGTAAITFTSSGGIKFVITVNGLSGPITGAHFHVAPIGVAGPVVKEITANFSGTTATGIWNDIPDSVLKALMTEKVYLNIHTADNPNGEIRGQLFHSSGTGLSAKMTGLQEIPSLNLGANGSASMTLMEPGLAFHITVTGLTGTITGAHFHYGLTGINGPVVKDITADFNGNTAEGIWRTTGTEPLNDTLIKASLTGKIYVNVHTSANPNGEIRGQVEVSAGFPFGGAINGTQEVPPVTTNGNGTGSFLLTEYGLIFKASVDSLSGPITGVHFHNAPNGSSGPVVRDLMTELIGKTVVGIWRSTDNQPFNQQMMQELFKGNIYINFHTSAHPNGEVRGQLSIKIGSTFSAKLEGTQETPAVHTPATGTGNFTITSSGLAFELSITGMTETIASSHFHYGSVGESGPVVKTLTTLFFANTAIGTWGFSDPQPFNDSLYRALFDGKIYVNIHTASAPAGLIRGQLKVSSGAGFSTVMEGSQEVPPVNTGAKGAGAFTLTPNGLIFNITVNGLSGPITGAHFHVASIGAAGPVVKDITPNIENGSHIRGLWNELTMGSDDSLFRALVTGRIYVNVHTSANPNGEIRGQVMLAEGIGLIAELDGAQETPPVNTPAKGTTSASLTNAGLIFFSSVDSLSGPITSVHFHNAPIGVSGNIVKDLFSTLDPVNNKNLKGVWRRTDNQPLVDFLKAELVGNNIYINYHTAANPNGEIRGQLITGDAIRIGIKPIGGEIPDGFSLSQNYPNPFNPATTIKFSVPKTSVVKLRLFDILGRETNVLLNKELRAGTYEYKFDASNLASGVYFYKLESSGFTDVKKMILIK